MTKGTTIARLEGRIELLEFLRDVAAATQGAEVWRALFAELRRTNAMELEEETGTP